MDDPDHLSAASDPPSPGLQPSLWRTCRALANRERLRMIEALADAPSGLTVSTIAATIGVSPNRAGVHLRLLNSRGLLAARRSGRWIRYRLEPDTSISDSQDLLRALQAAFGRLSSDSIDSIYQMATAFTHPRRIALVKALSDRGAMTLEQVTNLTGFSSDAIRRHLAKLKERGVVYRTAGKKWKLISVQEQPGKTLLRIACAGRN